MKARAKIQIITGLDKIAAAQWDQWAGDDPFVSHAFLHALEASRSVAPQTGWQPCHLILETKGGEISGVMPLYLKSHSQGEYVFDHAWADALERAGHSYYPKLVSCVPFTPVTGQRLMTKPKHQKLMLRAAIEIMNRFNASSFHLNFLPECQWSAAQQHDMMPRIGIQFHWHNKNYDGFDEFLASLTSRRRKAIRKERAAAQKNLTIKHLTGKDLTETVWDQFFEFYMDTGMRKWGHPYLTRECFSLFGEHLADRILLIIAERDKNPIAGALNFIGGDRLYGRYWGCSEHHPFLHFELSYYQAIDYALAHGLSHVEAGAQGPHKIERGYEPVKVYSAHKIAHQGLAEAVGEYLGDERCAIEAQLAATQAATPFRKA